MMMNLEIYLIDLETVSLDDIIIDENQKIYTKETYNFETILDDLDLITPEKYDYSLANKVVKFALTLKVPEGEMVGQNFQLLTFQIEFIFEVFKLNNITKARVVKSAILSISRKNGKTAIMAIIVLAFMCLKDLAVKNSQLYSLALKRDQASIIFELMRNIVLQSPVLEKLIKIIPSGKTLRNLKNGVVYKALSTDAGSSMGYSCLLCVNDEYGQQKDPAMFESIVSSSGAYSNALNITISTEAPDGTYPYNQMIDDYIENPKEENYIKRFTVSHDEDAYNPRNWHKSSPALGFFRSKSDFLTYAKKGQSIPSTEPHYLNLYCNQRISTDNVFVTGRIWKGLEREGNEAQYYNKKAVAGLDLSLGRLDFSALVILVEGEKEGEYVALPYTFTSSVDLVQRENDLKIPLSAWINSGDILGIPSKTADWDFMGSEIMRILDLYDIQCLYVDAWRFGEIESRFDKAGYIVDIEKIQQSYKGISPLIEVFEELIYSKKISHLNNSALNFCMQNVVITEDNVGNKKFDKSKSINKIDTAIALLMCMEGITEHLNVEQSSLIHVI